LSASLIHGRRALLRIKHVPEQLFDVTLFPLMMTLMFTYLFGGALAGSPEEYLRFFLPGILVQTVALMSMHTGMSLNIDIQKGVFDRFRSLPAWRPGAFVGLLLGDAMRYSIASAVTVGVGLLLGYQPAGGAPGVVAAVALLLVFAFGLSWVWAALALYLRSEKAVASVSMMVLFPLTFVSNIFVDPATMPEGLQAVVEINPISHLVTAVRGLMAGDVAAGEIGLVLLGAAVLIGVFGTLTMHRYRTINRSARVVLPGPALPAGSDRGRPVGSPACAHIVALRAPQQLSTDCMHRTLARSI
jgi:ABC-2 type transport system permease protein